MKQLIFVSMAFSAIACSGMISGITIPIVDCIAAPVRSTELNTLQSNLLSYWTLHGSKWPGDKLVIMKFSDSTGVPLSPRFRDLMLCDLGDSVLANYLLVYEERDTTAYKSILGQFCISVASDTTINLRYNTEKVEMKNGTICTSQNLHQLTRNYRPTKKESERP
jgi:hypothetical protein